MENAAYRRELKTLLALAIGDKDAILEGCDWIHHFNDLPSPTGALPAAPIVEDVAIVAR